MTCRFVTGLVPWASGRAFRLPSLPWYSIVAWSFAEFRWKIFFVPPLSLLYTGSSKKAIWCYFCATFPMSTPPVSVLQVTWRCCLVLKQLRRPSIFCSLSLFFAFRRSWCLSFVSPSSIFTSVFPYSFIRIGECLVRSGVSISCSLRYQTLTIA